PLSCGHVPCVSLSPGQLFRGRRPFCSAAAAPPLVVRQIPPPHRMKMSKRREFECQFGVGQPDGNHSGCGRSGQTGQKPTFMSLRDLWVMRLKRVFMQGHGVNSDLPASTSQMLLREKSGEAEVVIMTSGKEGTSSNKALAWSSSFDFRPLNCDCFPERNDL